MLMRSVGMAIPTGYSDQWTRWARWGSEGHLPERDVTNPSKAAKVPSLNGLRFSYTTCRLSALPPVIPNPRRDRHCMPFHMRARKVLRTAPSKKTPLCPQIPCPPLSHAGGVSCITTNKNLASVKPLVSMQMIGALVHLPVACTAALPSGNAG